jgi:hypothetical protein
VAPGGADNTWITQVGDAKTFGSFAAFRSAVASHPVTVTPRPAAATGLPGGFDVAWDSPTEGALTFGQTTPLTVKGAATPIDAYPRYDNPWSRTPFDATTVKIADSRSGVTLDFASGKRTLIPPKAPPPVRPPHHGHGHPWWWPGRSSHGPDRDHDPGRRYRDGAHPVLGTLKPPGAV